MLQQLLRMHIRCNSSPLDLLEDMACNILPQVTDAESVVRISVNYFLHLCYLFHSSAESNFTFILTRHKAFHSKVIFIKLSGSRF